MQHSSIHNWPLEQNISAEGQRHLRNKEAGRGNQQLDNLPQDIVNAILERLDLKDLYSAGSSCRTFRDSEAFREVNLNTLLHRSLNISQVSSVIERHGKDFSILRKINFPENDLLHAPIAQSLTAATRLEKLTIAGNFMPGQDLVVASAVSELYGLKAMEIDAWSGRHSISGFVDLMSRLPRNLKYLKLSVYLTSQQDYGRDPSWRQWTSALTCLARLPKLEALELSIDSARGSDGAVQTDDDLSSILKMPYLPLKLRHLSVVTEGEQVISEFDFEPLLRQFEVLGKLKILKLQLCNFQCEEWTPNTGRLERLPQNIEMLSIDQRHLCPPYCMTGIAPQTLKTLEINDEIFCYGRPEQVAFDSQIKEIAAVLTGFFKNIEELTLSMVLYSDFYETDEEELEKRGMLAVLSDLRFPENLKKLDFCIFYSHDFTELKIEPRNLSRVKKVLEKSFPPGLQEVSIISGREF